MHYHEVFSRAGREMYFLDKDTRELLPFIQAASTTFIGVDEKPCDGPNFPTAVEFFSEAETSLDQGISERGGGNDPAPIRADAPICSPGASVLEMVQGSDASLHTTPAPSAESISVSMPLAVVTADDSVGLNHQEIVQCRLGSPDEKDAGLANETGDAAENADDGHSIDLTQTAEVDQEASILVRGYAGEIVARLHIDQDIVMIQDIDLDLIIDGDGRFSVQLDQDMHIDQEIDIDLDIFDADGVLYVDLHIGDSIEVEQEMTLDVNITDGSPSGMVKVSQSVALDQDVDIDIDIDDDLEERYMIKVDIDVTQEIDTNQEAFVDVTYWNGAMDLDVDAMQTATIDHDVIAQIDFALA